MAGPTPTGSGGSGDNRRDEGPLEPPVDAEYQSCPQCGCPHPITVDTCSFCRAPLPRKVTLTEKWRRRYETTRWRYKLVSGKKGPAAMLRRVGAHLGAFLLGLAATAGGVFFVVYGLSGAGLSYFFAGVTFCLYGGYAIYHAARGKIGGGK